MVKGIPIPAKMKMVLSPISRLIDYIKGFMKKVDTDVCLLPSNNTAPSTISMPGKVLQLTKNIVDKVSQV